MARKREKPEKGARRSGRTSPGPTRPPAGGVDVVDEESEQSFPASDAPSWTPVTGQRRWDYRPHGKR